MQILPLVASLSEDASEHVRAALASVILGLAPLLGREGTIASLLPLLLRLLKDPTPQVSATSLHRSDRNHVCTGLRGRVWLPHRLQQPISKSTHDPAG